VEFLSNLNVKPALHERKAPRTNVKPLYWRVSGEGSGWMQDPFIFNLKSTDDNGGMKEDPVEMKTGRKIEMNFH